MDDRRANSRTTPSFRNGMLLAGGERYFVRIDEETNEGFEVAAQYLPEFPVGTRGRLFVDRDQEVDVVVVSIEPAGIHVRIALERCERPQAQADLRNTFVETPTPKNSNWMPVVVASVFGLAIGCVFTFEPFRHWAAEIWRRSRFF